MAWAYPRITGVTTESNVMGGRVRVSEIVIGVIGVPVMIVPGSFVGVNVFPELYVGLKVVPGLYVGIKVAPGSVVAIMVVPTELVLVNDEGDEFDEGFEIVKTDEVVRGPLKVMGANVRFEENVGGVIGVPVMGIGVSDVLGVIDIVIPGLVGGSESVRLLENVGPDVLVGEIVMIVVDVGVNVTTGLVVEVSVITVVDVGKIVMIGVLVGSIVVPGVEVGVRVTPIVEVDVGGGESGFTKGPPPKVPLPISVAEALAFDGNSVDGVKDDAAAGGV